MNNLKKYLEIFYVFFKKGAFNEKRNQPKPSKRLSKNLFDVGHSGNSNSAFEIHRMVRSHTASLF